MSKRGLGEEGIHPIPSLITSIADLAELFMPCGCLSPVRQRFFSDRRRSGVRREKIFIGKAKAWPEGGPRETGQTGRKKSGVKQSGIRIPTDGAILSRLVISFKVNL
jgi:hypothetical protein